MSRISELLEGLGNPVKEECDYNKAADKMMNAALKKTPDMSEEDQKILREKFIKNMQRK